MAQSRKKKDKTYTDLSEANRKPVGKPVEKSTNKIEMQPLNLLKLQ
jgi:hypothetical protein